MNWFLTLALGLVLAAPAQAASPLNADGTHQVAVLPSADLVVRYSTRSRAGAPVRIFYNPKKEDFYLSIKPLATVGLYEDLSAIDRMGGPEKIKIECYNSAELPDLTKVSFSRDFRERNRSAVSKKQWSKDVVCSWARLTQDTARQVSACTVYDVHSIGRVTKTATYTITDPISDFNLVFIRIGKETWMIVKRAGESGFPPKGGSKIAKLSQGAAPFAYVIDIDFDLQKNSLAPSTSSINLNDPQWSFFSW